MESISLTPFKKEYQVKVGQELTYQYTCHPSVGLGSEYSIGHTGQPGLIVLKEERKAYKYPEKASDPLMTGGDEATVYLVFKALTKGSAVIVVDEYYRGDLKGKHIFEIEVIE